MTRFVFFTTPAGALFIATHFALLANKRRRAGILLSTRSGFTQSAGIAVFKGQLFARGLVSTLLLDTFSLVWPLNLHMTQEFNDFKLKIIEQGLEQLEGFAFVLLLGILLSIGAQVNTLAKLIHGR